jgi:hypothetical protein
MFHRHRIPFLALVSVLFASCSSRDGNTLFSRLDEDKTGVKFRNTLFEDGPLSVANYVYFYNGGGVAIGDINNDGLQDVLFTGNMVHNKLYLNKGNFTFEDITKKSGVADLEGWCMGATMADVNGDGNLDIYICRSADINPDRRRNLLYINNGDMTFTEKADEYGLGDKGYSTQAAFLDYDRDGDLDCFIINHSIQKYTAGVQDNPKMREEYNEDFACKLYRNDNGHFSNVSREAGINSDVFTFGLGVAVADFNKDGWPDIFVSNDFNEPDYYFVNNRNGTFTESLSKSLDLTSLYSMGSDAADVNNDGLPDIMTLDMLPEDNHTQKMHAGPDNFDKFQFLFKQGFYYQYSRNMLQRNNGDGTFSEIAQLAGVSNTDWSWTPLFADFDNDGRKDLFVTNGYVKDYTEMDFLKYSVDRVVRSMHKDSVDPITEYLRKMPTIQIPNYLFQNAGDSGFLKRNAEWGIDQKGVSAGAAYADLDNDGDLDLVVNNTNEVAGIFRNNAEKIAKNHFLRVHLNGTASNARGIGTKVSLFVKGQQLYQEQSPVRGFQSSSDPTLVFGVGQAAVIDSLVVTWPDGRQQRMSSVKADQTLVLKATDVAAAAPSYSFVPPLALFNTTTMDLLRHRENPFNDFNEQSLMPNYLSRQGPCMAVADVNKDGLDDLFMGGAQGQPGQLLLQDRAGKWIPQHVPDLLKDAASEDVAAIFFDADKDGDPDLYVASGGYETAANDPLLQDRLYLNDGKGHFTKKIDALPSMLSSKGCVRAADIDGDGDPDLFVGGRVVPGAYPTAPRSYVLLNDGKGTFSDATAQVCPALTSPGMVTDAAWIDLNKDNRPDLVVVGEWMPVMVFLNKNGTLTEASASYIHFPSTGWWNRVSAEDMDGDGDADLVLGNCGTNTQFKVSANEPMTIYYKDFDKNGRMDPVLCYYVGGKSYPAYSLDDMTFQMPILKKKFLQYKSYADATIDDLFTPEQMQGAGTLKAENMKTLYLENQGDKGFFPHELPIEAQYAPVYGIVMKDLDGDGKKDILLAGNNTWTRIKFGRNCANHGVVLKGDGKGGFRYLPQLESGLQLRGNVRSLVPVKVGGRDAIMAGVNDSTGVMISGNR